MSIDDWSTLATSISTLYLWKAASVLDDKDEALREGIIVVVEKPNAIPNTFDASALEKVPLSDWIPRV